MRFKVLLVGLAAAMLWVSAAVAAPPTDKGKKPTTGAGCKPRVTVVLKGTLEGAPLSVDVTSGNRWGRAYVEGTANTSIAVNDDTKVRRQGQKKITDLVVGDRVLVQAKVCKADLKDNAMPALMASKVIAHPAKDAKDGNDDD
jgi:opacity protein-like surface antigen